MNASELLLAATGLHAGFSLVVTVVVYPALAEVGHDAWPSAHAGHSRRITYVVAPLYALLLLACGLALAGAPSGWEWASVGLTGAAMAVTAVRAGPIHGRGTLRPGSPDLRALLVADRVRCVAAVSGFVCALVARA